jgi:hypothetical protein
MPSPEDAARYARKISEDGVSGRAALQAAASPAAIGPLALGLALTWICAQQWNFVLDDAFISLRYARNLFEGYGPVWNVGEQPVEGYTNFLWMLFCSAHFHFTDHPEDLLVTYGRVAGLLLVVAVWWELLRRGAVGARWLWLGVGLVATHQQIHAWTSGGLETHLFNLLVFVSVARFLREEFTPAYARRPWSAVVMSLALLTRPEGYLFGGVCGLVLVLRRTVRSASAPGGWRRVFTWGGICALVGGIHLIWRRSYYGDWLPNTFYAKVPGAYFENGIPYVKTYLETFYLHWSVIAACLIVAGLSVLVCARRSISGQCATLAFMIALMFAYVMYIGGDHFEFRLLTPSIALLALMLPMVLESVAEWVRERTSMLASAVATALLASFGGAIVLSDIDVAIRYPKNRDLHKRIRAVQSESVENFHRWNWVEEWRPNGEWLLKYAEPHERLAVGAAGIMPYTSRLPTIDIRGLNNRDVARMEVKKRGRIGHERLASDEYLRDQKVIYYSMAPPHGGATLGDCGRKECGNDTLFVQLLNGNWWKFRTFADPDGLRRTLRERGAVVHPGQNEDPDVVEPINRRNRARQSETS